MLRLRTTTELSLLALAIGVAGTGWLSAQTSAWRGPASRLAAAHAPPPPHTLPVASGAQRPVRVVRTRVAASRHDGGAPASVPAPAPTLTPLAMPGGDTAQPWYQLRGHLDGRVLLQLDIDGRGHVRAASVSESSGDPLLDAHAVRSVLSWRFAVPPDHPDGFSGELPMRFSSQSERVAQLP